VKHETSVKSFKKCGISNALVATEGAVLSEGSESSELTTVMMIVMKTSRGGMTSMKFILHHYFAKCLEFQLYVCLHHSFLKLAIKIL
jgi:hypothetical protein